MIWLLEKILCALQALVAVLVWALITTLTILLTGVGNAITWAIAQLPNMPDGPDWGDTEDMVFGYAAWAFPIGFLVEMIGIVAGLMVLWWVASIVLRWFRAA